MTIKSEQPNIIIKTNLNYYTDKEFNEIVINLVTIMIENELKLLKFMYDNEEVELLNL